MSDAGQAQALRQRVKGLVGTDDAAKALLAVGYSLAIDDAIATIQVLTLAGEVFLPCDKLSDALVQLSRRGPVL